MPSKLINHSIFKKSLFVPYYQHHNNKRHNKKNKKQKGKHHGIEIGSMANTKQEVASPIFNKIKSKVNKSVKHPSAKNVVLGIKKMKSLQRVGVFLKPQIKIGHKSSHK